MSARTKAVPLAEAEKARLNPRIAVFAWLSRDRPTKPGETYGVPGQGDTLWLSVASITFLLFIWWLVTALGWVQPLFVPSPGAIFQKFVDVWQNGFTNTSLLEHVAVSTARVFGAFVLACLIGIPLGLAMGMSPAVRGIFDPPIEFYRPIPPLAYLPLMIIWFGIGETSKVLLIFLSVFAPVALGARAGVRSAAIEQIHAISPEAAKIKGIVSPVAGQANILVVPDLEAGNMLAKNLTFLGNADAAGIVIGARVPVVLTSRADTPRARMASCAVAALFADYRAQHQPF